MLASVEPSSLGLRGIELLAGMPVERLDAIARECAWRNFATNQAIVSRHADDRSVYLLVSGRVRITTYSAGGRKVTFRDLGAGAHFGDVAALDDRPRSADVVALEPSLLASMSPAAFRRLLRDDATIAERVMKRLAALVRLLSDRVIELSTLGVSHRVHVEVLLLARDAGPKGNRARIEPAPTHADIASRVSTNREQVTRELSALARAGIVAKEGRALIVCDVARLERMVEEVRRGG